MDATRIFTFEYRDSGSPLIERLWLTRSEGGGTFMSSAGTQSEMVITKYNGKTTVTMRGPETQARPAPIPENAEFLGITFKLGTFIPQLPTSAIINGGIDLPEASANSFWLNGSAWEIPDYENVDTFIERLVKNGLLVHEPVVGAALQGELPDLSLRSVQRRFLRATGLTHSTVLQIERARQAAEMLAQGITILDTVYEAGYADQPHLTRSLKRYLGQTPAQLLVAK